MNRILGAIAVLAGLTFLSGCSDTGKPPAPVPPAPQARIFFPQEDETRPIADSALVYAGVGGFVGGSGASSAPTVHFLFARRSKLVPDTIGVESEPVDTAQVPAQIKPFIRNLPAGWSLYSRWWFPGPQYRPPKGTYVGSGERVQLFVLATDGNGAQGRSDLVRVRVLNTGDSLVAPDAKFTITPQQGRIMDVITFDPNATTDKLDPNDQISVRWDFDGNAANGWDLDWDKKLHADEKVIWQFREPRVYRIALEAHNSYLPDEIASLELALPITTGRGIPNPPDSANYVIVPAGTYTMGDSTYVIDGVTRVVDASEMPVHQVQLRREFQISKYEVTNALYLRYLEEARAENPPAILVDLGAQEIRYWNRDGVVDTTWVFLRLDPTVTKVFYDLDNSRFRVKEGFEDHPVTGVTWRGADAFCAFYGLRLPTEAEWEVAARGDHSDYAYPFGPTLNLADGGRRANYRDSRGDAEPFPRGTTPVGFFSGQVVQGFQTIDSPSAFGLYDMAGNVAEWVADWFDQYPSGLTIDPQGPIDGQFKVARGGSYELTREGIRCTARGGQEELEEGYVTIGFRPAYTKFEGSR